MRSYGKCPAVRVCAAAREIMTTLLPGGKDGKCRDTGSQIECAITCFARTVASFLRAFMIGCANKALFIDDKPRPTKMKKNGHAIYFCGITIQV